MKKILFLILLIPISLFIGFKFQDYYKNLKDDRRRLEIKQGVHKIFNKCQDISSFESRRDCFKDDLIKMRADNKRVNIEYIFEINNKKYRADSSDLNDLIQIKRPPGYTFSKCSSNTFFFDWVEDYFYLSLENPIGGVKCSLPNGVVFYILPKNLDDSQILNIKNSFKIGIK